MSPFKLFLLLSCLVLLLIISLIILIPSIVVLSLSRKILNEGLDNKNNVTLNNSDSTLLPFNPYDCPKSQFYPYPFLISLQIQGPTGSQVTLTLSDSNATGSSGTLSSCIANCSLRIPGLDNVYAFVSADSTASITVYWGCYYFNLPFLLSTLFTPLFGLIVLTSLMALFAAIYRICTRGPDPYESVGFGSNHSSYTK